MKYFVAAGGDRRLDASTRHSLRDNDIQVLSAPDQPALRFPPCVALFARRKGFRRDSVDLCRYLNGDAVLGSSWIDVTSTMVDTSKPRISPRKSGLCM
ncbi:hypothetical protein MycrhDRAFT_5315 [Mycolicibacterium rhodesiae JS60]|nr:hypothetical protein MycrhDRAFT_5315 [Mycolicibacterium rhodesiae JS60]